MGFDRQVFDDVATELAMAILQYFQTSPSEEHVFRCMRALAKFAQVRLDCDVSVEDGWRPQVSLH